MPMKNSINTEMRQRMWKELVNGRAVWKTVKSVQTDIMKVDTRVRSSVRPAEIECIWCLLFHLRIHLLVMVDMSELTYEIS